MNMEVTEKWMRDMEMRILELGIDQQKMVVFLAEIDLKQDEEIAQTRKAVQALVEALARVKDGTRDLSARDLTKITNLLDAARHLVQVWDTPTRPECRYPAPRV